MRIVIEVELENLFEIRSFKEIVKHYFKGTLARRFKIKKLEMEII